MHKRTTIRALAAATMSLGLGLVAQSASAADTGRIKIGRACSTQRQAAGSRQESIFEGCIHFDCLDGVWTAGILATLSAGSMTFDCKYRCRNE